MIRWGLLILGIAAVTIWGLASDGVSEDADQACVQCHQRISPGQVADWKASKHSEEEVGCAECHGTRHVKAEDYKQAVLPDEHLCAQCTRSSSTSLSRGSTTWAGRP